MDIWISSAACANFINFYKKKGKKKEKKKRKRKHDQPLFKFTWTSINMCDLILIVIILRSPCFVVDDEMEESQKGVL